MQMPDSQPCALHNLTVIKQRFGIGIAHKK